MAKKPTHLVQDETLRLILSQQEDGYIQTRLASARKSLVFWSILGVVGVVGVAVFASSMNEFQRAVQTGIVPEGYYTTFLSLAAAIVALVIAVLKLPFTILDCRRYKRFQQDHEAFLDKYDRAS